MKRSTPVRALWAGIGGLGCMAVSPGVTARADTATFFFAPHDMSYLAMLGEDSPLIGQEVVLTRIYLSVESYPASDAGLFVTDIGFPIKPPAGDLFVLTLIGSEMGWSGSGVFHYFAETKDYNGTFISMGYGAETFSQGGFFGRVMEGSRIEFVTVPQPSTIGVAAIASAATLRRRRTT